MSQKPSSFPLRMSDPVRAAVDEYCLLRSMSMNTAINSLLGAALGLHSEDAGGASEMELLIESIARRVVLEELEKQKPSE